MLSAYSRPADVSSADVYHGHPLSDWLDGSNIFNDGTALNHDIVHPDYMAAGTMEFNAALIYSLANLPTPEAARFNVDRVTEAFVELEFSVGSRPYSPEVTKRIESPGGTIFRPGTLTPGQSRTCLPGPPATHTNVFYPMGSTWSKNRRPNLAAYVAQVDAFGLDSRIGDPTLRGDYWFGCFVRDVRAMQARHSDGRTWNDSDNLTYYGREGQSAHYASKSWLAYGLQHQNGPAPFVYENKPYELEFSRTANIEAEDPAQHPYRQR